MPKISSRALATDRQVRCAKPRGKRTEYRIAGSRNLVLRVTAAGTKSWAFLYAEPTTGRRRKMTLGAYPAITLARARHRAVQLSAIIIAGADPAPQRNGDPEPSTFAGLATEYMAEHRRRSRSGQEGRWSAEVQRLLDADILPELGHHRVDGLTRAMLSAVVERVAARGSFSIADKVLGVTRAIYNWVIATGRTDADPTRGLRKRNTGRPRNRVLSDAEIRGLWLGLEQASELSPAIRDSLRLQLLLGLRVSEALAAARNEIDLPGRMWILPAVRTKARREHRLPLSPQAAEILHDAIERAGQSPWLFPSPANAGAPMRAKSASRALLRIRQRIGINGIGTHDLRRTMATRLGDMGVSEEIIARILNHAPQTVTARHYNFARHEEPMRQALIAWAERLQRIVERRAPDGSGNHQGGTRTGAVAP